MDNLIKILFVQSNPLDTSRLRADKEFREIYQIAKSGISKMEIEKISATRVKDLFEMLMHYRPNIIHFSGHGTEKGIIMEDDDGNATELNNENLSFLLKTFKGKISCVFLNSCYSVNQAQKISEYIPFVIGVNAEISDEYAIRFATIFYRTLPLGTTIVDCYNYSTTLNIIEDTQNKTQLLINPSIKEAAVSYSMMMQQERMIFYKKELSRIVQALLIAKNERDLYELHFRTKILSDEFGETFELSEIKKQIRKAIDYHCNPKPTISNPNIDRQDTRWVKRILILFVLGSLFLAWILWVYLHIDF